ncbi:MAG: PulJ/GspJ family protein [Burkholderiaceae bacterium]
MSARNTIRRPTRKRGFTLVELLVAITILAIVATLGWRGLDGIVRARIALSAQLEQTRGMQLTFAQLQSDCAHIVSGSTIPNRSPLAQDANRLTLVRTVFADNQPTRLQVVSYRLKDNVLTRRESSATRDLEELDKLWMAATNDADTTQEVVLQSGVRAMNTRAWIAGSGWVDMKAVMGQTVVSSSSGGSTAAAVPTGLEVSLILQGSEVNMTKIFLLGPV